VVLVEAIDYDKLLKEKKKVNGLSLF